MFDSELPGVDELTTADDATVVAAITGWARAEAAASARRLAAIAELVRRRADGPTDCAHWSCDNWDSMAAEVAAAQGISHGLASGQMYLAAALRDRLPRVAGLFADGTVSARLAATIVWHTDLIKDAETLRLVDKTLAEDAARYGPLSANKTAQAIDAVVYRYDPGALRRNQAGARNRDVVIDLTNEESGIAALWGRLYATDAAALDRRQRRWPTTSALATRAPSPSAAPTRWARWPPAPSDSAAAATTPTAPHERNGTSAHRVSSFTSSRKPRRSTSSPTRKGRRRSPRRPR